MNVTLSSSSSSNGLPQQAVIAGQAVRANGFAVSASDIGDDYADRLVTQWELNDPRDRWKHTGEPRPVNGPDEYGATPPETPTTMLAPLTTTTPVEWRGTESKPQRWLANGRIPMGDLTILSGNGGSGKTEIALQLLVAVAAGLRDWLGSVVEEKGPALFLSCEEPEEDIRTRVERICKHRQIDPYGLARLNIVCPDLQGTWLASANRDGHISKTPFLHQVENWIAEHKPRLVVVDNVAAVFDGNAISRREVRAFLAMLRQIAHANDAAILLLDHPSVRGMNDGTGTANSVDWRNSPRSMISLSYDDKHDPDVRTMEIKKSNYGRVGEKTKLRWNGLTFTTDEVGAVSPHRAAAEDKVDDLFMRLLDKFAAQGREVRESTGTGYAPHEFADDPEAIAAGVKAKAFGAAMARLFASRKIITVQGKRSKHIERTPQRGLQTPPQTLFER